ncbi:MAG: thioredoxin family protein [Chlorobiaceae bacterium]|nr:thioredoxin family protein [Chlorobiaceae bacterium]
MVKKVWLILLLVLSGLVDNRSAEQQVAIAEPAMTLPQTGQKVTFVELGSMSCIPCKKMQPVMQSLEKKYGVQLKVLFYDVWNPGQRQYAEKYAIRIIPTQVFLDSTGREFFRHEGFFPEEKIDLLLKQQGLAPLTVKP